MVPVTLSLIYTRVSKKSYAEPVYRQAEQEWKHFIEAFTDVLAEVDPQIPHLPPKDVIHRIYRDVRDLCFLSLVLFSL